MSKNSLADHVDHFRARVLQDALNEATAAYWLRRAEAFENARTRPGDRPGTQTTPEARRARDEALAAVAEACRARASLVPLPGYIDPATWAALAEATENTRSSTTTASSTEDRSAA